MPASCVTMFGGMAMGRASPGRHVLAAASSLRLVVASALVSSALLASLPAAALDPARDVTQYVQQTWTTQEGLPQNTVSALLQASDGYLWFGTEEGLVRFDGAAFTVFDKTVVRGMRDNAVSALFLDSAGYIWVGTWSGDLVRGKNGIFEDMVGDQAKLRGGVWSIVDDKAGDCWAATSLGLLRIHSGVHTLFTTKDGLPTNDLRTLCRDGSGGLWIGTRGSGLFRMRAGRFEVPPETAPLKGSDVWSLLAGRDGSVWIGTKDGRLYRLKDGHLTRVGEDGGLSKKEIRSLCEDQDGNLWVGTNGGGLSRMTGGRFETLATKNGFPDDAVNALFEDREGSLWVGTWGSGLVRLSRGKFLTFSDRDGLAGNVVRVICQDASGAVWIGTSGSGLSRYYGGKFTTFSKASGLPADSVRALLPARDGSLWIGTEAGGLDRYSAGRWSHLGAAQGLGGDFVVDILERRDGSLWAGTYGGGLVHTEGGRFSMMTTRDGLPNNEVWCLHEDRQGRLWVGTTGGLALLEGDKFRVFVVADGLASDVVISAFESEAGSLWFGTSGGGLARFKDGRLKSCTRRDGLYDDVVFQILPDGMGNLWMSCNKGLFKVPLQDLEDFADGRRTAVVCTAFGKADGMGSSECMGGSQPAGCVTRDGRLWFPTADGLVSVDPTRLPYNTMPPPLNVEALLADGKPVMAHGAAVVPAGTHGVDVRYTALSLRAPERVRFRYRLVGFDDGWVEAGSRRTAYYTNVPPGRYRFEMRACNEDGVWNEAGTSVAVRVLPRFYQTVPFYLCVAFIAAAAAWGGYRMRVRQLQVRERTLVAKVEERTAQLRDANVALEDRTRQVDEANRALEERGRELEIANRHLTELTHLDALTGIANRRHFDSTLDAEWRRAFRTGATISILMADVDFFKAYNDTYGHPSGDSCLQRVAFAFQSGLRRAGDLLARYGGEEFVIVLPDMALQDAKALAEELRLRLRAMQIPHSGSSAAPAVTVSFGAASCRPVDGGTAADLVTAADRALYRAKERGRNRVETG